MGYILDGVVSVCSSLGDANYSPYVLMFSLYFSSFLFACDTLIVEFMSPYCKQFLSVNQELHILPYEDKDKINEY